MRYHILIILLIIGALLSCEKDGQITTESDVSGLNELTKFTFRSDQPPIKANGLLQFEDYDHLTSYYLELDELYDSGNDNFINLIESSDHNSVYKKESTQVLSANMIPFTPFVLDPVINAIVNEDYEFQIGDWLITYINADELLMSHISKTDVRDEIRNMDKGRRFDINEIPKDALLVNASDVNSAGDNLNPLQQIGAVCGCNVTVTYPDCNSIRISGSCRDFFGDGEASVRIYNNVLVNSSIIDERIDGSFSYTFNIFDLDDRGCLSYEIDPDCITGSTQRSEECIAMPTVCDREQRTTGKIRTDVGQWESLVHETKIFIEVSGVPKKKQSAGASGAITESLKCILRLNGYD